MIPTIGTMIAFYIITRMVEVIINKQTHGAVAICAFITTAVCVIGVVSLVLSGAHISSIFNDIPLK
jgi:uncharacterized membrane protein YhdT